VHWATFYFRQFFEIDEGVQIFGLLFSAVKNSLFVLTNDGLGYILGTFPEIHLVTLVGRCCPGLPDDIFLIQKSLFGKILEWNLPCTYVYKMFVYFMAIWYILWPLGILCGHLVYFVVIWYIFPVLVYFTDTNLATLVLPPLERPLIDFDTCCRSRHFYGFTDIYIFSSPCAYV
jgi:hypothetical protein